MAFPSIDRKRAHSRRQSEWQPQPWWACSIAAVDPAAIEGRLRSLGFDRVVGVPELYESLGTELGSRFWLADRASYAEHRDDIEHVGDLWADPASRELYRSLLRFRIRWDANSAPRPAVGAQYFPPDVPRGAGPMRFVDCGAFVGDTLATVAELGMRVDQVFAFEPDVRHFAQLARYGTELASATGASIALWPCAVAAESSPQRFRGDDGEAGHLARDGDQLVTAVALDDALPGVIATDLKMDIEGAELDALRGAEELIRRGRPRLAICVYHRPDDLWRIPMFVRDLDLSYDFYLRSHALFGFDVVMYAVPRA